MNRLLVALGALAASALLVPDDAAAQRGGHGGGGIGRGGGFGGGFRGGAIGGGFRGGTMGGGFRAPMFRPPVAGFRGGIGGPGIRTAGRGFPGGAIGVPPGAISGGGVAGIRPGFRTGIGGYGPAAIGRVGPGYRYGVRPGFGPYGVRAPGYVGRVPGVYRPYYRGYYGRGWRYPYYGGYYGWGYPWGWDDDWGWGAAGIVTGTLIGAAAASPYPVYGTPVSSAAGGYCATPVRTCALIDPAPVGTGCSCRTPGGRARGTVVLGR